MYIGFTFNDGSNPYIAITNKGIWNMIKKYEVEQEGEQMFKVISKGHTIWTAKKNLTARDRNKAILRGFAEDWQNNFDSYRYSWMQLADWMDFFREYGAKFGLLKEFRENGIC